MDIGVWILIDTLLLGLNVIYVGAKVVSPTAEIGLSARLTVFVLVMFVMFPLGLMPVGVLPLVDLLDVPRNWFWHFKIGGGFSFGDLLLTLLFSLCILDFIRRGRCNKYVFVSCAFIILIFSQGVLSAFYINRDVDVKNILNASRSFLIVLSFVYFGYLSIHWHGRKSIERLSSCLWVTFVISCFSMALLNPEFRAIRYWAPSMLQSQQYVSAIPFFFIYFAIRRHQSTVDLLHFKLWAVAGIVMLFFGYKAFYFVIALLILFYYFSKFLLLIGRSWGVILLLLIVLAQPFLLYINFFFSGFAAVDTRAFQVINLIKTFEDFGLRSWLFGIGWGQWYTLYFDFPTIDEGAWTPDQLNDDSRRHSIQVVPFSLLRSIGLVGVISVLLAIALYIYKISRVKKNELDFNYVIFGMILLNLTTFLAIPDVLPETVAFSAFFVGAMMAIRDSSEITRIYCGPRI